MGQEHSEDLTAHLQLLNMRHDILSLTNSTPSTANMVPLCKLILRFIRDSS
jgi:hypothetical protein